MGRSVYTADMGNPPVDDDMMSNDKLRKQALKEGLKSAAGMGVASGADAARAVKEALKAGASSGTGGGAAGAKAPIPPSRGGRISDADILTADKIKPGADLGKIEPDSGSAPRGKQRAGFAKGGMCCSASKRADGAAIRGKTRGRIV